MFGPISSSQKVDPDRDFPALAAAITALPAAAPGGTALAAAGELRALMVLQRRLAAAVLDRLACFDAQGFALASGAASTAAWVRAYTNLGGGPAANLVAAARTTRTLPLLAAELTAGRIGVEHLQALAHATRLVPDDVLAAHDKILRDAAPHSRPADLHRLGAKITDVWDTEAAAEHTDHAEDTRRLTLSQTLHGVWALDGSLTPEAGAKLTAALEPLMRKRGPEDDRTAPQRRADALLDLVDIALRSGALPDSGGDRTRITLLVHATHNAVNFLTDHQTDTDHNDDGQTDDGQTDDGQTDDGQTDDENEAADTADLDADELDGDLDVDLHQLEDPGGGAGAIDDGGQVTTKRSRHGLWLPGNGGAACPPARPDPRSGPRPSCRPRSAR